MVDFFNGVLKEDEGELIDEHREQRREREKERAASASASAARAPDCRRPSSRYERHSFAVNFVPFGAGQFQNGQRAQGLVVPRRRGRAGRASRWGRSPPTSRSTASAPKRAGAPDASRWAPSARTIDRPLDEDTLATADRVQVVSGGLFFAVAIWGVIDAILNFQPEVHAAGLDARQGRARASAPARGSTLIARRPRRRLAVLKGNRNSWRHSNQVPGKGTKVYHIHKKITSLGRSDEADVVLPDPVLADSHAHIHFDGRDFNLATTEKDAEIVVNGKKRSKHKLAHEDRIRSAPSSWSSRSTTSRSPTRRRPTTMARAGRRTSKLYEFSPAS